MPYRTFAVNEILTAANVQTNLMDQAIATFTDATARDAAITSPTAGQYAHLTTGNILTYYNGSAWETFSGGGSSGFEQTFMLMGA